MGSKYTTQAAVGYNSSPPADDGSQTASNLITWAGQKTKLTDPLKTEIDAINTALVTAFDYSVRQITTSDNTVAGDHMKCVEIAPTVTTAITISLGDAATMTNNYRVFVKNSSAVVQTLGRVTSGDTLDGTAANMQIPPYTGLLVGTINAATGYVVIGSYGLTAYKSNQPFNLTVAASVGSNALTIALKNRAGNDPTPADPVIVPFRNATVATGDFSPLVVTAASSVVVSSGSTLGTANSTAFRLWIVGFNDAGTFRLGVINCLSTTAGAGAGRDVTSIYPLAPWGIGSSTAEGGAGAADSAQTFYTGTAVSSKAYTVLGYVTYESGLATAGTYASVPTRVQIFGDGVPLPGQIVQVQRNDTGAVATGSTLVPLDDTIPQNTEGDQYMTQAITPSSAANVLRAVIRAQVTQDSAGANNIIGALFQDATANAIATVHDSSDRQNAPMVLAVNKSLLAATTSSTTLKFRAGPQAVATVSFNGSAAARKFGGTYNSFMHVEEVMA